MKSIEKSGYRKVLALVELAELDQQVADAVAERAEELAYESKELVDENA